MASHIKFKLPPLKVTHHSQKEARTVYRGQMDTDMEMDTGREQTSTECVREPSERSSFSEPYGIEDTDPTLHELHRKATVNAWEKLGSNILFLVTEKSAMPFGQVCMVCNSSAVFKCERCGPNTTVFHASASSMTLPISFMLLKVSHQYLHYH